MSNEMAERVARAIFQISPDETVSRPSLMAADRAIAAMREPTEAMLTAGQEHFAEVDAIIVMHAARQGGSGITLEGRQVTALAGVARDDRRGALKG